MSRLRRTWVRDPETHQLLAVEYDQSFTAAMDQYDAAACACSTGKLAQIEIAGGSVQVVKCCVQCGERMGNPVRQSELDLPTIPKLGDFHERYKAARADELERIKLEHARRQKVEETGFLRGYKGYLKSPEWAAKRQLVIKRCGNVCEGCGEASVEHIHHLTYDHLYNEFLFELLGLCVPCHRRVHADDLSPDAIDGVQQSGQSDEDPFAEPWGPAK